MWKLQVNATVDAWVNATDYVARRTIETVGLEYDNHLVVDRAEDVRTFTYYFAIHELWSADGLGGSLLPRLAAVLLVVFSGLWPHLKLVMLNLTWFVGRHPRRRTRTLQWLSGLGKWSLADVLVVCVMVGVLHLDWVVDPAEIKQGVVNDLPALIQVVQSLYTPEELCDRLLQVECATQRRVTKIAKCKACHVAVAEGYDHPDWAQSTAGTILNGCSTSGGGTATMRVAGMRGIYAFCGAAIMSIVLSLMVDIFDHKARTAARRQERDGRLAEFEHGRASRSRLAAAAAADSSNDAGFEDTLDGSLEEPLLLGESSNTSAAESLEIELAGDGYGLPGRRSSSLRRLFGLPLLLVSLVTTALIWYATDALSMERLLHGAGPQLLREVLGVDFEKQYSFQSLMWTTGAAGGWDWMLMGTFGLFCVVGPALRAVLVVATVLADRWSPSRSSAGAAPDGAVLVLAMAVNFVGSFCAWEVFAIAVVMVQMLMPSITDTIVTSPVCGKISSDGSCLRVEFNVVPAPFATVLVGGCLLVGLSALVSGRAMNHERTGELRAGSAAPGGAASASGRRIRNDGRGIMGATTTSSRVMPPNHGYERIHGMDQGVGAEADGRGLDELVFETNQV